MCDITTLFNTNTDLDLCCFEQSECATFLCGEQNKQVENINGTISCYLDQALAADHFDKAPNGTCGGSMACALKALSSEPSVTLNQELLPTSYSSASPSATSSSSQSSSATPLLSQGMMGVWAVAVLTLALFGRKINV